MSSPKLIYEIVCRYASGRNIVIETAPDRRHAVKRVIRLMADPQKPPYAVIFVRPQVVLA